MGVKSSVQESNTEVLARSQTLIVDQESRCFPLMSTVLIFFLCYLDVLSSTQRRLERRAVASGIARQLLKCRPIV